MNTNEVEGLEDQLKQAKERLRLREAAARLHNNHDWQELIVRGFMRDDAARFAQEAGDPALSDEQRNMAMEMAKASGHLKRYLSTLFQMGGVAQREIPELELALEEARVESDANDGELR